MSTVGLSSPSYDEYTTLLMGRSVVETPPYIPPRIFHHGSENLIATFMSRPYPKMQIAVRVLSGSLRPWVSLRRRGYIAVVFNTMSYSSVCLPETVTAILPGFLACGRDNATTGESVVTFTFAELSFDQLVEASLASKLVQSLMILVAIKLSNGTGRTRPRPAEAVIQAFASKL